ncbi:MAG: hypothetical protein QOH50_1773 [Kribbellaceae bacterium]|jgi:hypothetical protein|nr:hypothetical protein [Kribbellaceae bacterium]
MAWVAMIRSTRANWWLTGMPARLDADSNDTPCEVVYLTAAVNIFWYQ